MISRRGRKGCRCAAVAVVAFATCATTAQAGSVRFHGTGSGDIDRVKIRIDDPATNLPGPPADVGSTDFTIEFWLRSDTTANGDGVQGCAANVNNWIFGNIVFDRDRYNQSRAFGISLGGGRVMFGTFTSAYRTICGTTDLRDGAWHHVAVQRRIADGQLSLYVDGVPATPVDAPNNEDLSYPDNGTPGSFCGAAGDQPCTNSDPFIVLGAEKHDATRINGPRYPSFDGWLDELRLSTVLRYSAAFTPPQTPFAPDADTAALYHFDEPTGTDVIDATAGNSSPGFMSVGGSPSGPERSTETPFGAAPASGAVQFDAATYRVAEDTPSATITVQRVGGSVGAVTVDYGTAGGTASAGSDYATTSGTLAWAAGDATPKNFVVPIVDDSVFEGDETFAVALTNATGGAALGARAAATVTIADNETPAAPGALEFTSGNFNAGEGDGTATITVRRISGREGSVGVSYATSNGTATAGSDYQGATGSLSWANGDNANKSFSVTLLADTAVEGLETVSLALSAPTGGATLGALPQAQLSISDDDSAPPTGGGGGGAFGGPDLAVLLGLWLIGKSGRNPRRASKSTGYEGSGTLR